MNYLTRITVLVFLFTAHLLPAQLTSLRGPNGGGSLSDLQTNDEYFFLHTSDGIYRSAGATVWEKIGDDDPDYYNWGLLDVNGPLVLAISGKEEKTLHISHDNGDTWTHALLPDSIGKDKGLGAIAGAIAGQRILLCNKYTMVWESSDLGQNWVVNAQYGQFVSYYDVKGFGDRIYIGMHERILVSDNNGFNFIQIDLPAGISANRISVLDSLIFINDNLEEKLYRWNNTNTWQASNLYGFFGTAGYVVKHNGALYAVNRNRLARSEDFGLTWKTLSQWPTGVPYFIGATGGILVVADKYNSIVFHSTDPAGPWTETDNGIVSSRVRRIAINGQSLFAGADNKGLFRYDRSTGQWGNSYLLPCKSSIGDIFSDSQNRLFAIPDANWVVDPRIGLSTDNGQTWQEISPSYGDFPELWDAPFNRITAVDQTVFGWTELTHPPKFKLYQTKNLGVSWIDLSLKITQLTGEPPVSFCLQGSTLFVGTAIGVARSDDNGDNWSIKTNGLPVNAANFTINRIRSVDSLLFAIVNSATDNNRLYRSGDQGENWEPIDFDFPPLVLYLDPLNFVYRYAGNLILQYYGTLYLSADEGLKWVRYPGILPEEITSVLPTDSVLYIGTGGRGVWKATAQDIVPETVSGRIFWDDNNNGIQDLQEKGAAGVQVNLDKYHLYTSTDNNGDYHFQANFGAGGSTLSPLVQHLTYTTAAPLHVNISGGASGVNFALSRTAGIRDLSAWFAAEGRPVPGKPFQYTVAVRNQGSTVEDVQVAVTLDAALEFVSAQPAPQSVSGNTLYWTLNNQDHLSRSDLRILMQVPAGITPGTEIKSVASVLPSAGDATPANNTAYAAETVVGAPIAVDKSEIHDRRITKKQVEDGERLVYTIRFQNTGTTPVERVVVSDPISYLLDRDKIQVIAASHPFTWTLRSENLVEFTFDQINLPDSASNPAASQGFVTFSVPVVSPSPGKPVYNWAGVYFDYQAPVYTPTIETHVLQFVSTDPGITTPVPALIIFPNPNAGLFSIDLNHVPSGQGVLEMIDMYGRKIRQETIQFGHSVPCDVSMLPSGAIAVLIRDNAGRVLYSGRVIIQR